MLSVVKLLKILIHALILWSACGSLCRATLHSDPNNANGMQEPGVTRTLFCAFSQHKVPPTHREERESQLRVRSDSLLKVASLQGWDSRPKPSVHSLQHVYSSWNCQRHSKAWKNIPEEVLHWFLLDPLHLSEIRSISDLFLPLPLGLQSAGLLRKEITQRTASGCTREINCRLMCWSNTNLNTEQYSRRNAELCCDVRQSTGNKTLLFIDLQWGNKAMNFRSSGVQPALIKTSVVGNVSKETGIRREGGKKQQQTTQSPTQRRRGNSKIKRRRRWHNGFPTAGFHHVGCEILSAFPSKNQHGGRGWLSWVWRAQHSSLPSAVELGPQGTDLTHYCSSQAKRWKIGSGSGHSQCHRAVDSGACHYLLIYQTSQSIQGFIRLSYLLSTELKSQGLHSLDSLNILDFQTFQLQKKHTECWLQGKATEIRKKKIPELIRKWRKATVWWDKEGIEMCGKEEKNPTSQGKKE